MEFTDAVTGLLTEYGVLVTFMTLTIAALVYAVWFLWKDNRKMRDDVLNALINNTGALTELKETIRHVAEDQQGH